jgi:YVTN family beta-propeller protein
LFEKEKIVKLQFMSRRVRIARLLATTMFVIPSVALAEEGSNPSRTVGPQADGSIVASNNQTLTPAGTLVNLGAPLVAKAVAVNPVNKTAAVLLMSGPEDVVVFSTVTGAVIQNFKSGSSAKGSFNGIAYSADGTKLYYSQDNNHFVTANVDPKTGALTLGSSLALPTVAQAFPSHPYPFFNGTSINPGGIAVSSDGSRAYVALNAANTLGVINLATATLQTQILVGNVPNSVVVSADGHYAYVSNEGGRPAKSQEFTSPSDGAAIVADPTDAFATTGTVSVVDLTTNTQVATIDVGLHPAGMTISGTNLYVANSYSDTVSVVDLHSNKVVRTIDVGVPLSGHNESNAEDQQRNSDERDHGNSDKGDDEAAARRHPFGSGPNGIAIVDGRTAYVTLGQANAVAVVDLADRSDNQVVGYIPTAYFPTSIAYDAANKQLVVADDKGVGASTIPGSAEGVPTSAGAFNTHNEAGRVSLIPLPNARQLGQYTEQVIDNNHWSANPNILVGPEFVDRSAQPVPVPKHIGEPSKIKHVFLIVKENRTYDQMLGDVPQGRGDPNIAIFASATPNQHALIKRFPLLDNIYAPSRQSADGHNWIVGSGSFYSNDILSPDWIRSYPYTGNDAMTYTPRGFLWSAAQKKGLSVKLYGEYSLGSSIQHNQATGKGYTWDDFYNTAQCIEGKIAATTCQTLTQVPFTAVSESAQAPSAQKILDPHYPSLNLGIPEQYRMDYWIPIFEQQVASNTVPSLTIMSLGNDHTNGTSASYPAPINYQADNDLALGRIVEAISNSKIWEDSAIFVEEDDTQDGVDHIDGHRMPAYVISPWTARPQAPNQGKVVHTTYTQENINRTIENILGLEPLTQFDLVASPMFDVFGNVPDLTPYTHVAASIPLNQSGTGTYLGWSGLGPSYGELELSPAQKAWMDASNDMIKGAITKADSVDESFLNHSIWYSATNWKRPYPGETEILMPTSFVKAAAAEAKTVRDGDDD